MNQQWILIAGGTFLLGIVLGLFIRHLIMTKDVVKKKEEATAIVNKAKDKARDIVLEGQENSLTLRENVEKELNKKRTELSKTEDRLDNRREQLDRSSDKLEQREHALNKHQSSIDRRGNEIDKLHNQVSEELQRVSGMTSDEAKERLLADVEKEITADIARIIRQIEANAKDEGETKARKIIADAIQRVASEHVSDITTSSVALPSDDMKGRIIGRGGRNIQSFEKVAGVDVIVDDTPEAVTISSFDPVRREIAKRALSKLVLDGRIHPGHIEKFINKEKQEVEKIIAEAGDQAAYDAGVPGLHKEVLKVLGRLKFRTSYGQNQLAHAVESAQLASVIAAELGADVEVAKAGALLHDIGKALDHNVEGTHAQIGADFVKRYGVNTKIVNAIASHHHEVEQITVEAVIVEVADAISGARPGARRESLEQYLKRIRSLEEISNSYKGVKESYALQAGREVRIFVKPEDVTDGSATRMARDIAKQIEESMQYPGQIKVTVIRESRSVDYAK